jgi:hypothetical protein
VEETVKPLRAAIVVTCVMLVPSRVCAFNTGTHYNMNRAVIWNDADFTTFLQTEAGFPFGPYQELVDNSALECIAMGGVSEDEDNKPVPFRFLRHFHDPLQPWTSAGLTLGLHAFASAIIWMQLPSGQQDWSWLDARDHYWTALTSSNAAVRDQNWANTFRGIGQVMHLIEDTGSPNHVRNDQHVGGFIYGLTGLAYYGNLDYWAETNESGCPLTGAAPFDRDILFYAAHWEAPVPVANLIDTDRYDGFLIPYEAESGLAEFTNANFFSEDTIFSSQYHHPDITTLVPTTFTMVNGTVPQFRQYWPKSNGDGVPVDPVLARGVFDSVAASLNLRSYSLDERVWAATAGYVCPKAVDYAQGALDYFFRGRIEIAAPDRYVYGRAAYVEGNTGEFTKLVFKVRNATQMVGTTQQEEAGSGTIQAVVRYRVPYPGNDLTVNPNAPLSDYLYAVSAPQTVSLTRDFQELTFDFSNTNPIPTNSADWFLMAVFRGPLGLENDSVLVGGMDVFEPDPIDIINGTDWDCYSEELANVGDFNAFPPICWGENPPPPCAPLEQTGRDLNNDGIADVDGPYSEQYVYTKISSIWDPIDPSPDNYDSRVETKDWGKFSRFFIVQDEPEYVVEWWIDNQTDYGYSPAVDFGGAWYGFEVPANYNFMWPRPDGKMDHYWAFNQALPILYRGEPMLRLLLDVVDLQQFLGCLDASIWAAPCLTRVDAIVPP